MSLEPSASSVPLSSWNSSTTPSTKLKTVKPSLTAILKPNNPIFCETAPTVAFMLVAVVHKVAIPGTFAFAIAADGEISALTIVPSTMLSEVTAD